MLSIFSHHFERIQPGCGPLMHLFCFELRNLKVLRSPQSPIASFFVYSLPSHRPNNRPRVSLSSTTQVPEWQRCAPLFPSTTPPPREVVATYPPPHVGGRGPAPSASILYEAMLRNPRPHTSARNSTFPLNPHPNIAIGHHRCLFGVICLSCRSARVPVTQAVDAPSRTLRVLPLLIRIVRDPQSPQCGNNPSPVLSQTVCFYLFASPHCLLRPFFRTHEQ